ncbi:MAG: 2-phosphosulfolactate phosphatase [Chloroflexota bacterium]
MKFTFGSLENCATTAGVVIVIDVLRAFLSTAFAFEAGADSISLVGSVEEAVYLKNIYPDWILMGELNGLPPLGFDLGNSPTQIRKLDLTGKKMIQRTSAGTQGMVHEACHLITCL